MMHTLAFDCICHANGLVGSWIGIGTRAPLRMGMGNAPDDVGSLGFWDDDYDDSVLGTDYRGSCPGHSLAARTRQGATLRFGIGNLAAALCARRD